jgi:nicotinate-nucleotide adenylyltransferase
MNTGLFFGSFNPVHIGHLIIAEYMVEFPDLDQVWFVVSPQNPLKQKETLLKDIHRLQLVRVAVENDPRFKVSAIELDLPKPSFTINTMVYLYEKYPQHKFSLILGADNLESFPKWKNHEHLLEMCELYVYPRKGSEGGTLRDHPNVKMTNAPVIELSSSFVRSAIKEGRDVEYMMPEAAYRYLREMHFYEK